MAMDATTRERFLQKARSFAYWHYSFDLGDGTAINPEDAAAQQRMVDFLWRSILEFAGGRLEGLRVLDVGCNAGFWSVQSHKAGAAYVLGVDARSVHIDQASLVRDALGISRDRLEFRQMNVYDLSQGELGQFDVCLLLRVLHHLRHPMLALDRLREVARGLLVADVRMYRAPGRVLELKGENRDDPLHGVDGFTLSPTREAVEFMLETSGFVEVRLFPPSPTAPPSYSNGKRALFGAHVRAP